MYKEYQIVMLSTDKAEDCLVLSNNKLWRFHGYFTQDYLQSQNKKSYHLYIVSDETINKNDWCIETSNDGKEQILFQMLTNTPCLGKKVISTTDKLNIHPNTQDSYRSANCLPQIPQSFIEHYIQQYNNKNVIDKVLVEYVDNGEEEWLGNNYDGEPFWNEKFALNINSNNEITIKLNKTSWNKDEVIELLFAALVEGAKINQFEGHFHPEQFFKEEFNKWISKNF